MLIKKSEKASLEKDKLVYVLMGFIIVVSLCYVAMEWTEKEVTVYEEQDVDSDFEDEMDVVQTEELNTPPPPPPEPEQIIEQTENLTVVDENVETEAAVVSAEDNPEDLVEFKEQVEAPEEDEEEDVIFQIVETMPEFPGGAQAMFKFLSENVHYPAIAAENGIQGKVQCQFTVNKDGSIVDVVVVRSAGDASLDKEAIRVIKSMPKWNPGKQRGKPVRVKYTIPVNFKLQ